MAENIKDDSFAFVSEPTLGDLFWFHWTLGLRTWVVLMAFTFIIWSAYTDVSRIEAPMRLWLFLFALRGGFGILFFLLVWTAIQFVNQFVLGRKKLRGPSKMTVEHDRIIDESPSGRLEFMFAKAEKIQRFFGGTCVRFRGGFAVLILKRSFSSLQEYARIVEMCRFRIAQAKG